MKIVFMGTPDFAVPALDALVKAGHEIPLVFTQPDKPKNRGHKLQKPPVKEAAEAYGIEVFQPLSLRRGLDSEKSAELLKKINPDCIIVAAYGQILPRGVLDLPKYGCINIHASLLPKYRGAAPINHCIINGETETGISIMHMADGIDTGDVIITEHVPITRYMNASDLHNILMNTGAKLIIKAIDLLESGNAPRIPQDDEKSCYAPMLTKETCKIDWKLPAETVFNLIRGLSDSPGAYTFCEGKRLKVYSAEITEITAQNAAAHCGEIIDTNDFTVLCGGTSALRLCSIQLEGGKRMDAKTFLLGNKVNSSSLNL